MIFSYVAAWYLRFKSGIFELDPWFLSLQEYMKILIVIVPMYLILYYIFLQYFPSRTQKKYCSVSLCFPMNTPSFEHKKQTVILCSANVNKYLLILCYLLSQMSKEADTPLYLNWLLFYFGFFLPKHDTNNQRDDNTHTREFSPYWKTAARFPSNSVYTENRHNTAIYNTHDNLTR